MANKIETSQYGINTKKIVGPQQRKKQKSIRSKVILIILIGGSMGMILGYINKKMSSKVDDKNNHQPQDNPENHYLIQPQDKPQNSYLIQPQDKPQNSYLIQPQDKPQNSYLIQPQDVISNAIKQQDVVLKGLEPNGTRKNNKNKEIYTYQVNELLPDLILPFTINEAPLTWLSDYFKNHSLQGQVLVLKESINKKIKSLFSIHIHDKIHENSTNSPGNATKNFFHWLEALKTIPGDFNPWMDYHRSINGTEDPVMMETSQNDTDIKKI
jgi:hypothetical protein